MSQNFKHTSNNFSDEITIADLYPQLSPEEQSATQDRLLRYLGVIKRIFERVAEENPEILTELEELSMLRKNQTDQFKH